PGPAEDHGRFLDGDREAVAGAERVDRSRHADRWYASDFVRVRRVERGAGGPGHPAVDDRDVLRGVERDEVCGKNVGPAYDDACVGVARVGWDDERRNRRWSPAHQ